MQGVMLKVEALTRRDGEQRMGSGTAIDERIVA